MVAFLDPRFTLSDAQSFAQSESERVLRQSIALQDMLFRGEPGRKDGMAIIDALVFGYEGRFGVLPQYARADGAPRVIIGQRHKDRILMPVGSTKTIGSILTGDKRHDPKTGVVMVPSETGDFWEREDGADFGHPKSQINRETEPELCDAVAAFVVATKGGNPEKFIADFLRDRDYRSPISQAEAQA